MFRLIGKIPTRVTVACSGGIDSMAVTHFLLNGRRKVDLAYFNHDTSHSKLAQEFVQEFAEINKIKLKIGKVKGIKGRRSLEEFWRDERYKFLDEIGSKFLVTCHHLDDVVETWLMSCFHGSPKLIPYQRNENIFRPFLMTEKKSIISYSDRNNIKWIEDPSNRATKNIMRNHIRHNLMPQVLKVNPGIRTTIRKKIVEKYKNI